MKKIFILALMVLVGIGLVTSSFADEARTISHKTKAVTSSGAVVAQGVTVYKVTGYANAANALYALLNTTSTAGTSISASDYKVEGGEATQYDSLTYLDFGDEGLVFNTGLSAVVVGAYLVIEYD